MNEWMAIYPYSHMWTYILIHICERTEKRNAYNEIYSVNSLDVECPPGQSMLSVYVMHIFNLPVLCIERRTLASHSSPLPIGL